MAVGLQSLSAPSQFAAARRGAHRLAIALPYLLLSLGKRLPFRNSRMWAIFPMDLIYSFLIQQCLFLFGAASRILGLPRSFPGPQVIAGLQLVLIEKPRSGSDSNRSAVRDAERCPIKSVLAWLRRLERENRENVKVVEAVNLPQGIPQSRQRRGQLRPRRRAAGLRS